MSNIFLRKNNNNLYEIIKHELDIFTKDMINKVIPTSIVGDELKNSLILTEKDIKIHSSFKYLNKDIKNSLLNVDFILFNSVKSQFQLRSSRNVNTNEIICDIYISNEIGYSFGESVKHRFNYLVVNDVINKFFSYTNIKIIVNNLKLDQKLVTTFSHFTKANTYDELLNILRNDRIDNKNVKFVINFKTNPYNYDLVCLLEHQILEFIKISPFMYKITKIGLDEYYNEFKSGIEYILKKNNDKIKYFNKSLANNGYILAKIADKRTSIILENTHDPDRSESLDLYLYNTAIYHKSFSDTITEYDEFVVSDYISLDKEYLTNVFQGTFTNEDLELNFNSVMDKKTMNIKIMKIKIKNYINKHDIIKYNIENDIIRNKFKNKIYKQLESTLNILINDDDEHIRDVINLLISAAIMFTFSKIITDKDNKYMNIFTVFLKNLILQDIWLTYIVYNDIDSIINIILAKFLLLEKIFSKMNNVQTYYIPDLHGYKIINDIPESEFLSKDNVIVNNHTLAEITRLILNSGKCKIDSLHKQQIKYTSKFIEFNKHYKLHWIGYKNLIRLSSIREFIYAIIDAINIYVSDNCDLFKYLDTITNIKKYSSVLITILKTLVLIIDEIMYYTKSEPLFSIDTYENIKLDIGPENPFSLYIDNHTTDNNINVQTNSDIYILRESKKITYDIKCNYKLKYKTREININYDISIPRILSKSIIDRDNSRHLNNSCNLVLNLSSIEAIDLLLDTANNININHSLINSVNNNFISMIVNY